jgi:hypothetical protein
MQNNVVVCCVALILRLLQKVVRLVGGIFVVRREHPSRLGLGALLPSVDLDSARLDAVSRSLMWGAGIPIPEPARAPGSPPVAPRRLHRHGPHPETFRGHELF